MNSEKWCLREKMHKKERDEEKEDILEVTFRVLPSIADVLQHHTFISQGK